MKRSVTLVLAAFLFSSCGLLSGTGDDRRFQVERITAETLRLAYPSPDDWHRLALYGNWDFIDPAAWREIAMQPDCDRATALTIFWKASPEYYVQFPNRAAVPEVNRIDFDLINLIRERWQAGAYGRANLAFDPETDAGPVNFEDLRWQYGVRVDQLMPADMRVTLRGRRLPRTGFHAPGNID